MNLGFQGWNNLEAERGKLKTNKLHQKKKKKKKNKKKKKEEKSALAFETNPLVILTLKS